MKLVCLLIVWDDWDFAYHQADFLRRNQMVDDVFIVYSEQSNFGEWSPFQFKSFTNYDFEFIHFEPDLSLSPQVNERNKRNYALQKAKEYGFTHSLMTDADEMYEPNAFLKEKERIFANDITGTVCKSQVYFGSPTLTIGLDTTIVPFIHKLTDNLRFEWNTRYPFAFEGPKREIRIDPTRQLNITEGVEISDIIMHHYSWVRKDYQKKIRNSTARANIERSTVLNDLLQAKPGYFCEFYRKTLAPSADLFGLCKMFPEEAS